MKIYRLHGVRKKSCEFTAQTDIERRRERDRQTERGRERDRDRERGRQTVRQSQRDRDYRAASSASAIFFVFPGIHLARRLIWRKKS